MSLVIAGWLLALHALASTVWVGGMFFAYMALRPAAVGLEPPRRLSLWTAMLGRFFAWVWLSVVVLLTTGFWLIFGLYGSIALAGIHVHIMLLTGLVMSALFAFLYFVPFRQLGLAVAAGDWLEGGRHLAGVRRIVVINLLLGLFTIIVGAGGRLFFY